MARRGKPWRGSRFRGYYRRFRGYSGRQWKRARGILGSWANRKLIGPIKYKHVALIVFGVSVVLVVFALRVLKNRGVRNFKGAKETIKAEMKKSE